MMPSFDVVNYSLRPNKSIQRNLIFDDLRLLCDELQLKNQVYVGFGSIWFTDFQLAHKTLGIKDMISIENSEIGYRRARFNRPYKTVSIEYGDSSTVLPALLTEPKLALRPWLVWLDYDKGLDENKVDDVRRLIESAPVNSVILATINASDRTLGSAAGRPQRLKTLLGDVVPDDLAKEECRDPNLPATLARLLIDYMKSAAISVARPGGFLPAFQLTYKDSVPMVTVGGVLPSKGAVAASLATVSSASWRSCAGQTIVTPPLTQKEVAVLQSALPRSRAMSRKSIQRLGFDLEDEQIQAFQRYYTYYPMFAQITT